MDIYRDALVAISGRLAMLNQPEAREAWEIAQRALASAAWQPIETAPRDGTWILTCDVTRKGEDRAALITRYGREGERWSGGRDWEIAVDGTFTTATHWMHVPAPPTVGDGAAAAVARMISETPRQDGHGRCDARVQHPGHPLLDRADDHIYSTVSHARMPTFWQLLREWWFGDGEAARYRRRLESLRTLACEFERLNAVEGDLASKATMAEPLMAAAWERRERIVGKLRDRALAELVIAVRAGARFDGEQSR